LNGVARVVARAKNGTTWSGPATALFVAGAEPGSSANLAITEIHYHAAPVAGLANADDLEFVELQNIGAAPISLLGVKFVRTGTSGITFDFSEGSILLLPPGERVLVVKNRAVFEAQYGTGMPITGEYSGSLGNSGDTLTLVDAAGATLLSFAYSDGNGWPGGADGTGFSLVLSDPHADPADAANWRTSVSAGGNPGGTDTVAFTGTLTNYVFGSDVPESSFDRATRIFSCVRRPGSDAVVLIPERSEDLRAWQSGAPWFVFAGETRDATGRMRQHWNVPAGGNGSTLFLRFRVVPR
jgi:hypothetical protein